MNKFTQTYKPINLEQRLPYSVEKTEIYSHLKKFREINLKHDKAKLISHNFVREMNVRVKFSEFHTVS